MMVRIKITYSPPHSLEQSRIILEQIVKDRNGGNVDELVKRVRENQAILRKMKVCLPCSFISIKRKKSSLGIAFSDEDI